MIVTMIEIIMASDENKCRNGIFLMRWEMETQQNIKNKYFSIFFFTLSDLIASTWKEKYELPDK